MLACAVYINLYKPKEMLAPADQERKKCTQAYLAACHQHVQAHRAYKHTSAWSYGKSKGYTHEETGTYHTKHMHMHLTGRHAVTPKLTQPHFSEAQHTVPGHTAAFSRAQRAL